MLCPVRRLELLGWFFNSTGVLISLLLGLTPALYRSSPEALIVRSGISWVLLILVLISKVVSPHIRQGMRLSNDLTLKLLLLSDWVVEHHNIVRDSLQGQIPPCLMLTLFVDVHQSMDCYEIVELCHFPRDGGLSLGIGCVVERRMVFCLKPFLLFTLFSPFDCFLLVCC